MDEASKTANHHFCGQDNQMGSPGFDSASVDRLACLSSAMSLSPTSTPSSLCWAPPVTVHPPAPMSRLTHTRRVARSYQEVDSDDEMSGVLFHLSESDDDGYQTDLTEPSIWSAHSTHSGKASWRGRSHHQASASVLSTDSGTEGISSSDLLC
ncbi:predicted protein [Histoplasma capsulatum var. duboisii H88]|uniref:Predicted protein n=1 Tax=Ajellomyces capsulatus (strain H88) TaxID=544711 RepID=F0U9P1_AJEC8|nr:predicted protein [Histoplasma capsulatum var. duboisii H88]